jgi:glutaredoxin 3
MAITLYSSDACGYCHKAKALLERHGLKYRTIDLALDDSGRDELVRRTGRMTFPQVIVNDRPIGGFSELDAFVYGLTGAPCT